MDRLVPHSQLLYGNISQYYYCKISTCQLLLEEDLRFLCANDFSIEVTENRWKISSKKVLLVSISLITGIYSISKMKSFGCFTLITLPSLGWSILQLYDGYKEKQYRLQFDKLINDLKELEHVNKSVTNYLQKTEANVVDASETGISEREKLVLQFFNNLLLYENLFVYAMRNGILKMSHLISEFDVNDSYLNTLCENQFLEIETIKDCVPALQELQCRILLFQSNFLQFVALASTPSNIKNYNKDTINITQTLIPDVVDNLAVCLKLVKTTFMEIKVPKKIIYFRNISMNKSLYMKNRLRDVLTSSTDNISFIVEKYQTLLMALEEMNNKKDIMSLEPIIIDLKEELFTSYQTLETFLKLLAMSNKKLNSEAPNTEVTKNFDIETPSMNMVSNKVIESQDRDEEYEAYLTGEIQNHVTSDMYDFEKEEHHIYVNEIEHALKTNKQFLDRQQRFKTGAHKKEENSAEEKNKTKSIHTDVILENVNSQNAQKITSTLSALPPLPPPLPLELLPPPLPQMPPQSAMFCQTDLLNIVKARRNDMENEEIVFEL